MQEPLGYQLFNTDLALRAQLAQAQQDQSGVYKDKHASQWHDEYHATLKAWHDEVDALKLQLVQSEEMNKGLAASQCEDPIAGEYGHLLCGRVLELERRLMQVTKERNQSIVTLEQQLAERDATIARLEFEYRDCRNMLDRKERVIQQLGNRIAELEAALTMLVRESNAVANDHHHPRYNRLDEALMSAQAEALRKRV